MASNYYIYNPADNLTLAQAILLANSDNGMSYIIPYEEKVNGLPAQQGISRIEADPSLQGKVTAESGLQLENLLGASLFDPVKEMVKRSVQQAPPAGWSADDVDLDTSLFTVLSTNRTPELATSLFEAGAWRLADTSPLGRGNPNVAYGGTITDEVFVDFAGHFSQTPNVIGEKRFTADGNINSGNIYGELPAGSQITAANKGNPAYGLTVDATGKSVTLVNFSVTSQGFGPSSATADVTFSSFALGVPLLVRNGDVVMSGDVVIDQVTQVVDGFSVFTGAIQVSGSDASATFKGADVYLGAVRGYESLIHASNDASLQFTDSAIYGFASSNSTAPNLPSDGLLWADFENKDLIGIQHLVSIDQSASAGFNNTRLFREEPWSPQGAEEQILNAKGRRGNWDGNDYANISKGEISVGSGGNLNIENSTILGSIVVRPGSGNVSLKDSQIAGNPVGYLSGSLVQLDGGNITIENTLIDSLDVNGGAGGNGTLFALGSDVHVLATNTPNGVPVTTRSDYTGLSSFAAPSQSTQLSAWADKDTSAINPSGGGTEPAKVNFQFFGPQSTSKIASNFSRELICFISEPSPPRVDASGALNHTVQLSFSEPVTGLDRSDLEQALGSTAIADGWQVTATPLSRDGGKTWTTTIQAPATSGSNQPIQLLAGAASSTFSSTLPSLASNTLTLQSAQAGGAPGGGSIGGGGTTPGGGGTSSSGSVAGGSGSGITNAGLDNDNLDESPQNHNGLIIDANNDGIADATQSNVAGFRRIGDGSTPGDYAALAVGPTYTLNAVTLLPITNNQVQVSLPSGGSITSPIPNGITALLEPLEFYVEGVTPGASIEAELFIPENFTEQTDAYMRFNYQTKRFEEYVDENGAKLYRLLDENADGKVDRIVFTLIDGDTRWDGDRRANGVIIDPGSPIDAPLAFKGRDKRDQITGNLLSNNIWGKGGNDRLLGALGRDVIHGGKGNDRIIGGEHGDWLKGGTGADRFIYHSEADSSADNHFQQDVISHFQRNDRIDLRHFDADASQAGSQHFRFIGKRFFSGNSGELRFHAGLLSADLDGDRIADFAVAIDGKLHAHQLLLGR